jgi:hypothetical protein
MVAPAGVNEELPQEPAKAGTAGAGTAEAEPSRAEETQEKAASATVVPADVVPPQAEPAEEERVAAGPADATSAGGEPAEARSSEAEPAQAGAAEQDPVDAGPAEADPAMAASVEAASVEAASVEAASGEAASGEAASGEADWDAEGGSRDVSPLAVAGIIFGVIALVGVAVGVLAVLTHGFRPKTVVTYRPAAVFALRPGQCVDSGSDALKFTVLSCARPHDAEVFAAFTLPAAPWPGTSAVQVDAGDGCANRLDSYIDPQLAMAGLTQEYVYPNQAAWQAGERTVVCEVSAVSGQLTGSVRAQG